MSTRLVLVASLFVHPGRETEFHEFEMNAARIMKKYGGEVERVIRPLMSGATEPLPHEIHIVAFPSHAQFEAYRGDPELASLTALRQTAIARTDIIFGEDLEPYR